MTPDTRNKIKEINSKTTAAYALQNFTIANTKNKKYKYQNSILKKCVLSAWNKLN